MEVVEQVDRYRVDELCYKLIGVGGHRQPDGLTRYYEYDGAGNRTALALKVKGAPYGDDSNTARLWHLDGTTGDVVDSSSNGNTASNRFNTSNSNFLPIFNLLS